MRTFLLVVWLAVAGSVGAVDDPWLIVPGKSVGKIAPGMEQSEVFRLLGSPSMQNDFEETDRHAFYYGTKDKEGDVPVPKGVTGTDWTTPRPVPGKEDGAEYFCDFVTVSLRDRKVVRIEVSTRRFHDAHGLSTGNTGEEWRKQYPHTERWGCKYHHPSAGGLPASKHLMAYEDAVAEGIGWRSGGWGNLAPELDWDGAVETVIIHAPGEKLLPDPDGGSRFVWKDNPNRRASD